jgi:SAM-dependent methyltransferase
VGVNIDLACGDIQREGFIGIDIVPSPYVDIVMDLEQTPYKDFPDECVQLSICSHFVEHTKPWLFIDIMNEWWRITKPGGQLMIATPYAGSIGYWQDPTHTHGFNELSFKYFDPRDPHWGNFLYSVYRPKPWKLEKNTWDISGTLEVLLTKIPNDPSYRTLEIKPANQF